MKKLFNTKNQFLILVAIMLIIIPAFVQKDAATWKNLFNEKNLDGWKMVGSKGVAFVRDSAIICHQTKNTKEHTFVCTKEKFKDFILEMDIKTDSNYNSGILLRSMDAPYNCNTWSQRQIIGNNWPNWHQGSTIRNIWPEIIT